MAHPYTFTNYAGGVLCGRFVRCCELCFQAVNTWHGFLPPGAYPCWARKAGTPPYSARTTAASAILSWPGRKKEPIAVCCPQPHQQVPVGNKRSVICCSSLIKMLGIAAWIPLLPSTRNTSTIWRQGCALWTCSLCGLSDNLGSPVESVKNVVTPRI